MVVSGWWLAGRVPYPHVRFDRAGVQRVATAIAEMPNLRLIWYGMYLVLEQLRSRQSANVLHGDAFASHHDVTAEHSFRRLDVWQEAVKLVEEIYLQSKGFPLDERYGLTAQLRRTAMSVPSNIGEGARRKRPKAYLPGE